MCLAVCGKIKSVHFPFAEVEIDGVEVNVNIQLIESPATGEVLLVHAGFAIQKINEEYFKNIEEVLEVLLSAEENIGG